MNVDDAGSNITMPCAVLLVLGSHTRPLVSTLRLALLLVFTPRPSELELYEIAKVQSFGMEVRPTHGDRLPASP